MLLRAPPTFADGNIDVETGTPTILKTTSMLDRATPATSKPATTLPREKAATSPTTSMLRAPIQTSARTTAEPDRPDSSGVRPDIRTIFRTNPDEFPKPQSTSSWHAG
jgi:hypothetical protein